MARPRLAESERRRRTIGVRVTAAEATELRLGAAELRELNTHLASGSGLIHRGRQGSHPLWFSCLRGRGRIGRLEYPWRPMKQNWKNRTMWTGDNLPILRGMNSETVDLIYLDPPFNSNRDYSAPIGSEAAGAAFKDTWTRLGTGKWPSKTPLSTRSLARPARRTARACSPTCV